MPSKWPTGFNAKRTSVTEKGQVSSMWANVEDTGSGPDVSKDNSVVKGGGVFMGHGDCNLTLASTRQGTRLI